MEASRVVWSCVLLSLLTWGALGERKRTKALEAGSSLELICEAHVPVHWCYPQVYATPDLPQDFVYESQVSVTYLHETKYITTLNISNITYVDTGYYHCARNNTEQLCNRKMYSLQSTYVYVEDDEHLLVVEQFKQVTAYKLEKAILPCLKTHPNSSITLTRNGVEIHQGKQANSSLTVTYDPRLGYVLKPTPTEDLSYVCTATWKNQTKKLTIDIVPKERKWEILAPVIYQGNRSVQNLSVEVGVSVNFTCYSYQKEEVAFDISWNSPSQQDVEIVRNNCSCQGYICKNSTLIVNNITNQGAGDYVCFTISPGYKAEKTAVSVDVMNHRVTREANHMKRMMVASNGSKNILDVHTVFILTMILLSYFK